MCTKLLAKRTNQGYISCFGSNSEAQFRNLAIFLRFYVKSIFISVESQNLLFWQFQHLWILILVSFCILSGLKFTKKSEFWASKTVKMAVFYSISAIVDSTQIIRFVCGHSEEIRNFLSRNSWTKIHGSTIFTWGVTNFSFTLKVTHSQCGNLIDLLPLKFQKFILTLFWQRFRECNISTR